MPGSDRDTPHTEETDMTTTTVTAPAGTDANPYGRGTERARMDDVRVGDVLLESGLRCVVTDVSTWNDPGYGNGTPRTLYVAKTRILNLDYLASDAGRFLFGGIIARDGSEGWTFQGIAERTVRRAIPPQV
jgi:hypothetical protein